MPIAVRPALPTTPTEFGTPVPVPPMNRGQDVRAANAQARGALAQANHRLRDDHAFYVGVCGEFSATPCGH